MDCPRQAVACGGVPPAPPPQPFSFLTQGSYLDLLEKWPLIVYEICG